MTLELEGRVVEIRGDPALTHAELSLETMNQMWEVEDQGFLVELSGINLNRSISNTKGSAQSEEQWHPTLKNLTAD